MKINIISLLQKATLTLKNSSETPKLDAEILLAHTLHQNRTYLKAYPEKQIDHHTVQHFENLTQRRLLGEPIAYLIGYKEFWSLRLKVNPSVLIPRSETELLVEKVLEYFPKESTIHLLELGTGSGAISLALASERSHWQITATDYSLEALEIAKENAHILNINNINFKHQNWFVGCNVLETFDVIVTNPPYINEKAYLHDSVALSFEPKNALFAENGLSDLFHIITKAPYYLNNNGWLFLEHGYDQKIVLEKHLLQNGYSEVKAFQDFFSLDRVIVGKLLK